MNWQVILYVIASGLLIWLAVRMIRGNPTLFSRDNISKSFTTIGFLTLGLIVFIALLAYLLKHG